ncbi:MAG: hypothetical protein OHK93_005979 [Ramalina farinacea]|uniref:Uncharacterized protein n=1 Tax=Ramalina farinacea TaxID=258253 RepID=A0AA43QHM4_9LECA|nr:hypothetical protein [Ramalina farinacea]
MHAIGSIPLRTLILATAEFDTREPRDKILALLGMTRASSVSAYGIEVDYSQPVEDLYRDVTGCLTVKTQSYHLLVLSQEPSNKRIPRLPSWVPDYSAPSSTVELGDSIMDSSNLLAGAGSITWSQGSSSLGVRASIFDEAELVAEKTTSGHIAKDLGIWLHILATYFQVNIKLIRYRLLHPFDEPELDTGKPVDKIIYYFLRILLDESSVMKGNVWRFASMLFPDLVNNRGIVVSGWMDMMQLAKMNAAWGHLGQATWFQDHAKFLTTNVHGLRLFITKSGRAGLGPSSISSGNVISQFHGRDVHYCLQPISSGHYILLGRIFFNDSCLDGRLIKQGLDLAQDREWQDIFLD